MSSEPKESSPSADAATEESPGLTIALPESCESVSEAIVTNREMLREPGEHGLATDEEITHLSEAIESLSGNVEAVSAQCEDQESEVADLRRTVDRQRRQIGELQSMVAQLMDILGTNADWETFED